MFNWKDMPYYIDLCRGSIYVAHFKNLKINAPPNDNLRKSVSNGILHLEYFITEGQESVFALHFNYADRAKLIKILELIK